VAANLFIARGAGLREPRRSRMLLPAGKEIARWEHDDIFGSGQHLRFPQDLVALHTLYQTKLKYGCGLPFSPSERRGGHGPNVTGMARSVVALRT